VLEQLDEELASARRMPIGGLVVVDRTRFADLLNELRLAIPANVRQARGVLDRSEEMIRTAEAEAARIRAAAEQDAARRISQSEIVRQAEAEAQRIQQQAAAAAERVTRAADEHARVTVEAAEQEAQQQREEADAYAVALLQQLQRLLGAFLGNVRESLRAFPEYEPPAEEQPEERR
jgi:hypothetical protein